MSYQDGPRDTRGSFADSISSLPQNTSSNDRYHPSSSTPSNNDRYVPSSSTPSTDRYVPQSANSSDPSRYLPPSSSNDLRDRYTPSSAGGSNDRYTPPSATPANADRFLSSTAPSSDRDHHREYLPPRPVDPLPMRSSPMTVGPPSGGGSSTLPDFEKDRLRAKVEELQALVDRQSGDLRRRNEELLDLQRNHEAFREKFILFREGMRSKTDESDARFRKLESELKMAHEELSTRREQGAGGDVRTKSLERQVENLKQSNTDLEEELARARKSAAEQAPNDQGHKDSIIKELSNRVANQAEYIRTYTAKVADLEARLKQAEEANTSRLDAEAKNTKALNAQTMKEMELSKMLDDERRAVASLRADVDALSAQKRAAVQEAEQKGGTMATLEQELEALRRQVSDARNREQSLQYQLEQQKPDANLPRALFEAQEEARKKKEEADRHLDVAEQRKKQVEELQTSLRHLQQDSSLQGQRMEMAEGKVREMEGRLRTAHDDIDALHRQAQAPRAAPVDPSGGAMKTRLLKTRDSLLGKLIGNWQKQTLGRSFAAWLRSIEAFKMDRILMESDKYMSMDSSIDDLLNDALSKRRARSIVASSVSLGGSSIDDDVFQAAAARPVSGGSVASFGNSSMSGSLEWMV